ncbi:aspartate--tRNA ligase, mitochondrial [Cydia amplana]|uniref:aspartate--tRNA ligase, mitochondrial n=1 Tax=Cydia amplana TaxID=1869771 RepID=UPI002FE5A9F6
MWRRNITHLKTFSAFACKQTVINTRKFTLHPLAAQCTVKTQPLLNIGASSVRHSSQRSAPLTDQFNVEDSSTENVNSFTYRTHTCGELRACNTGEKVSLCGWVQYLRLSKFLLLRDAYGIVQCTVGPENIDFSNIPLESVVKIHGEVTRRPQNAVNSEMSTGEIEVIIDRLEVLNMAENLPFNLREYQKPKEQIRMQHRYIDLRFPEMQHILRLRSQMLHSMRRFLVEQHGFVEVETPTLFCQTPGGAREFVVPTHHAGLFYSLVQSPQQFKQMLMSGGVDRYFQIARCYRDETTRPDRQPEFTQLDIEMSFTNLDGVLSMIESLLVDTFPKLLQEPPFRRMTYKYALENYGTDKPNVQYDLKLKNIKDIFPEKANDSDFSAYALPYPVALGKVTTKTKEQIKQIAKKYNVKVVLDHDIHKAFNKEFDGKLKSIIGNENASIISIGDLENACSCLGEIRLIIASLLQSKNLLKLKNSTEIFWLVDFPLFTKGKNGLETCHHPFTSPHPEDIHLLDSDPLSVRSLAYDLVMNGNEIGGGSVRVHNVRLQEKLLKMLGMDAGKLRHFLNALQSGCPPHAGIALGIDRLVSIVCNTGSIRDVIAFPKTHEGKDPLSGAPNAISDEDKEYYHIVSK